MDKHPSVKRPRDAATLIIVRNDGDEPQVLMGKRHEKHSFMPGKFVFPGGRVDRADYRVRPASNLLPDVEKTLLNKMKGKASRTRARALAMAAVRETFEEVGLVVGQPKTDRQSSKAPGWREFFDAGFAPQLNGLNLVARAITPPGRPRRFDARFFATMADSIHNIDDPVLTANDELLEIHWVTFDMANRLELPYITRHVLSLLKQRLKQPDGLRPGAPVPFQFMRGNSWVYDTV